MKRILYVVAAAVISAATWAPLQANAQINVNIVVPVAPPPVIVETVPPPRVGYIWAPGYWRWNGAKHVWTVGRWEPVREGYHYQRADWSRDGDKWRFHEGGWEKEKKKKHKHHDDYDDHDNRRGHFCPPGQAKKGNC